MRKIGEKRLVGTEYVRCKKCGIQLKPGDKHPPFQIIEIFSGFPISSDCQYINKIASIGYFGDDWNEPVCQWI